MCMYIHVQPTRLDKYVNQRRADTVIHSRVHTEVRIDRFSARERTRHHTAETKGRRTSVTTNNKLFVNTI